MDADWYESQVNVRKKKMVVLKIRHSRKTNKILKRKRLANKEDRTFCGAAWRRKGTKVTTNTQLKKRTNATKTARLLEL